MSSIRITHFTDPHLYGTESEALRGIATWPALRATLAHAHEHAASPDAILVTGDLVQDDPAGYRQFRRAFDGLGAPVLCLPGNHDDVPIMRRELRGEPYRLGPVVDLGAWRILLLDSCVPGSAGGRLSPATLSTLDAALASAPERPALVCLHHHPVALRSRWLDRVGLANGEELFSCLDRHRNVRAVLWGHVHQSYDAVRHGVRLLATPSTCAQFMPQADDFALDSRPPGYRTLELLADGSLLTEVVWVGRSAAGSARSVCSAA